MFNVQSFLANMQYDGARPNLFEVIFPALGNFGDQTLGSLRFKARATSIPSSTIGIAPVNYFGRQVKLAGNRVFDNWTITVMLDELDFQSGPRYAFERWSNQVNSHIGNIRVGLTNPLSYMQDAQIWQYGKNEDVVAMYNMVQCFPIDIGPVNLDWALDNQIAEFNVTFAMQYWSSAATT